MKTLRLLAALCLFACTTELAVPPDAAIECHRDAECPTEMVCAVDVNRCVPVREACVEQVDGQYRSVERGRRCTAEGGGDGVCVEAECRDSVCGDGIVDPNRELAPEACDDGEANSERTPDACRPDCTLPRCGDGVTDTGEECDDGNAVEQDACLTSCVRNVCGDGVLDPAAEECDDGNADTTDDCPAGCRLATCGDGYLWAGHEGCEGADDNPNDGCDRCNPTVWRSQLLVGHGEGGGLGTGVALEVPYAVVGDGHGGLFVADTFHNRVLRLDLASGRFVTVAGTGEPGFSGDGGPATKAALAEPSVLAVDAAGNLFVSGSNYCVRRVDATTGRIETVAGTPLANGYDGNGGQARLAHITLPTSIAVDGRGSLYLAEDRNNVIRRVEAATGIIDVFAGNGLCTSTGASVGNALQVETCLPKGLSVSGDYLYFSATLGDGTGYSEEVRRVHLSTRQVEAVAVVEEGCNDLVVKDDGTLVVATVEQQIVRFSPGGGRSLVAGTGVDGYCGDGGPATAACLQDPIDLSFVGETLYFADAWNNRIRRIDSEGTIDTVMGNGSAFAGGCVRNTCMAPFDLRGIFVDRAGRIVTANGMSQVVLRVDLLADTTEVLAGDGLPALSGDGGPGTEARLWTPSDVLVDPLDNIFIADSDNHRVRRIAADTGVIETYAGGDLAVMKEPAALAMDGTGNLYVVDYGYAKILRVDAATREVTVVAGTGIGGFSGDGGPATAAMLSHPLGIALDPQGRIVVVDTDFRVVRRIGTDGIIETIAGIPGAAGSSGDGGPPLAARMMSPRMVAIDPAGNLYVTDREAGCVRRIAADLSRIDTVAGGGASEALPDGGPATAGRLSAPEGLAFDNLGRLLVTEKGLRRIRRVDPSSGTITSIYGPLMPPGDGPLQTSRLGSPGAMTPVALPDGSRPLLVADGRTGRVRAVDLDLGMVETLVGYPDGLEQEGADASFSRILGLPLGIAADPATGFVYVSEASGHTIRRVDTTATPWTISTFAGRFEEPGFDEAHLYGPRGLLHDAQRGLLFVADTDNHVVRAVDLATGSFVTVAGTPGVRGWIETDSALDALFDSPQELALANDGSLYVADTGNHRVRRVTDPLGPAPGIETVTGYGVQVTAGEGSPASRFPIDTPLGLAVDRFGNLFIAGGSTVRVVHAGDDDLATGEDSVSIVYGREPREGPLESSTLCLSGLQVADGPGGEDDGRLLLLDSCQGYLVALDRERL